jgi:hypothetical protein
MGSILIGKHFRMVGMIDPVIGIARPNLSGCILSGVFSPSPAQGLPALVRSGARSAHRSSARHHRHDYFSILGRNRVVHDRDRGHHCGNRMRFARFVGTAE